MTPLTVLLSSVDCESRPCGGYAFVLPPRLIDRLGDTTTLRDSVAPCLRSRLEPEIVYDPWACATRRR